MLKAYLNVNEILRTVSRRTYEIRNLSDRIAVMYEGRIMGIVEPDKATVEQLGLMMAGVAIAP